MSLIEMIVVAALIVTGSAVAIPVTMQMVRNARGDSALVMTKTFLETQRNRAVAERRNMRLTISGNTIVVQRVEQPTLALTTVDSLTLEAGETFSRASGVPIVPGFPGSAAVNFPGATMPVMFTSDGSLIDQSGDPRNGSIYMGRVGQPDTQRAVTIWSVTGAIRAHKWRGASWQQ
jgi:type II secretory pathway pseudopilin PulG